ncbi:ABC transporter permease subunit [Actinoplanes sp. NPDC051861]|uniref:ABC transporter permease n=1 Tax=Actinoplanes sp. NPDC051861 TaxID=3155170 RepID=UPI00341D83BD
MNLDSPRAAARPRRAIVASPAAWLVWGAVVIFFLGLAGVIGSVVVNSFGLRWFDSWLPEAYTTQWYGQAWDDFTLLPVLTVTLVVCLLVAGISVLVGVPAAYVLARRAFPGNRILFLLFLLPILMPPITYGIPLATVLYKYGLAGHLSGVVLANLVPSIPFVILTMTPFIEQIDPAVERAARVHGARTRHVFLRILAPLLIPGILASAILVVVRTVGMFELTFLTAGPDSQTLVVALFYSMSAAGIRAQQSVDAMAVIYCAMMLVLLVVALRFVNPTQLVARVRDDPD